MCNHSKTCCREQRNPRAATAGSAGFGFAAGSGSSCWLTSVSPLPPQAGAAPALGTPQPGDSPETKFPKGQLPSLSLEFGREVHIPLLHAVPALEEKGEGSDAAGVLTSFLPCLHMFCGDAVIILKCFLHIFPARHQHHCHHPVSLSLQECPQGTPLHLAEQDVLV